MLYNVGIERQTKQKQLDRKKRKKDMNQLEKIRSNAEVHGLEWAAKRQQEAMRRNPCGANSFDVFYFALFGKWPPRREKGK